MTLAVCIVLGLMASHVAHDEELGPGDRRLVGVVAALAGGSFAQLVVIPSADPQLGPFDLYILLVALMAAVVVVIVADAIVAARRHAPRDDVHVQPAVQPRPVRQSRFVTAPRRTRGTRRRTRRERSNRPAVDPTAATNA